MQLRENYVLSKDTLIDEINSLEDEIEVQKKQHQYI